MGKLIVGTFLILGFAFYELSGGSDFAPETGNEQIAAAEIVEETPTVAVTRSESATLINVAAEAAAQPADAQVIQAVAEAVVVEEAAPVEVAAEVIIEEEPAPLDLRFVAGSRVNMRAGPGTDYTVLDTLPGGTQAEVIEVDASGWARIRLPDTGQIGWMAERLLTES